MSGFDGRVRFVVENYGNSALAKRYGVTRYPAIFVDDILVATPKDFGFYGDGEGDKDGRYAPWRKAESHERFRADLTRMVQTVLDGKRESLAADRASANAAARELNPARLPDAALRKVPDLAGAPLDIAALRDRVVLIEFWATWCPPCRGTLLHMGELKKKYGDRLEVIALAVESDADAVKKLATALDIPLRWAMSTPELARAFGDLSAVPTSFLFDGSGRTLEVFYGAPPDLHERIEQTLARTLR